MGSGSKWEYAENLVEAITYVIELVIFASFIYEESLQIMNKNILEAIMLKNKTLVETSCRVEFDYIMQYAREWHELVGPIALYGCNAYATYWYSSMMTREWGNIYIGRGRMDYEFYKLPIF